MDITYFFCLRGKDAQRSEVMSKIFLFVYQIEAKIE
jgi:hypothetical protein